MFSTLQLIINFSQNRPKNEELIYIKIYIVYQILSTKITRRHLLTAIDWIILLGRKSVGALVSQAQKRQIKYQIVGNTKSAKPTNIYTLYI